MTPPDRHTCRLNMRQDWCTSCRHRSRPNAPDKNRPPFPGCTGHLCTDCRRRIAVPSRRHRPDRPHAHCIRPTGHTMSRQASPDERRHLSPGRTQTVRNDRPTGRQRPSRDQSRNDLIHIHKCRRTTSPGPDSHRPCRTGNGLFQFRTAPQRTNRQCTRFHPLHTRRRRLPAHRRNCHPKSRMTRPYTGPQDILPARSRHRHRCRTRQPLRHKGLMRRTIRPARPDQQQ